MVNFLWIEVLSFPLLSFLHVWSVSCQRYVWNFVGRFETSNVRLICCPKECNFASIFLLLWLLEKNWIFKQFATTLAIWVQTSILLVWDINSCHLYFFLKILVIIVNNNMWPWASNLYMVVLQPMMIYLINCCHLIWMWDCISWLVPICIYFNASYLHTNFSFL